MTDTVLIKAALEVAAKGIPVFPTVNKAPSWSNEDAGVAKGMGGYKLASTDPVRVKELFSHNRAAEVSVPMGAMSGLMCIDCDVYKNIPGLDDWMDENTKFLGDTMCHKTRSGGLHFFFEHPGDNIRFPATLREGVDVKAVGTGYVVWPDGIGDYTVINDVEAKPFPMKLLKSAMKAKGGTGSFTVGSAFNDATDGELIACIQQAEEFYPALRTLSYRMPTRRLNDGSSLTIEQQIDILNNIMDSSVAAQPEHVRHDDWEDRRGKIPDLVESAIEKHNRPVMDEEAAKVWSETKSFIDTQSMVRRPGLQRETKADDIEAIVADIEVDFETVNAKTLSDETLEPIKWTVPGMIPEQGTVSLGGTSNVGKTRWLAALAALGATGALPLMGLPDAPAFATLWLANEERVDDIKRRIKATMLQHGIEKSENISILLGFCIGPRCPLSGVKRT